MDDHDPLRPHRHDPNPEAPHDDPTFLVIAPGAAPIRVTTDMLRRLPRSSVPECTIVSTGHGTSGPFTFAGVALGDLLRRLLPAGVSWSEVEVHSADAFGTRVAADELRPGATDRPILLADERDGRPLDRAGGLVRLIVPSETDDALRQVKWVAEVRLRR